MRTREDVAFAAGLYEGEGTVYNNSIRHKPYPVLRIVSTDLDALSRWRICMGLGRIHVAKFERTNPTWKDQYKLQVNGFEQVQAAIAMMWPWLSERRKTQALHVLLQLPTITRYPGKGSGVLELPDEDDDAY